MRLLTLLGTRPEIIRLSRVIARLDSLCEHVLVHTGQNHDPALSDVFFRDLGVRAPDIDLGIHAQGFEQLGLILARSGEVFAKTKPDRILLLGDTNSALAAIVAARMGIPVFHMEAGNRCYDDRVPEEINRRIIDHTSTILLPYTHRSKENLLREGIARERIFVTGNPIYEVLSVHAASIEASAALSRLHLTAGRYFLATVHRAENVDDPVRLEALFRGLARVGERYGEPVVVSVHPRTADRLASSGWAPASSHLRLCPPFPFFEFVALERHARAVLTDSGTVQEECAIFGVPSVTLRDVTERAETVECGASVLSGAIPEAIPAMVQVALSAPPAWQPPREYMETDVSGTVVRIALGHFRR